MFDVIGIDPPLANALRRIMISEVPTMAIEKVRMFQNLSVIADEVLAHWMGLIPIKADPADFEFKEPSDLYNEKNSLKYSLHVKCTRKGKLEKGQKTEFCPADEDALYNNHSVFASDMKWIPLGY